MLARSETLTFVQTCFGSELRIVVQKQNACLARGRPWFHAQHLNNLFGDFKLYLTIWPFSKHLRIGYLALTSGKEFPACLWEIRFLPYQIISIFELDHDIGSICVCRFLRMTAFFKTKYFWFHVQVRKGLDHVRWMMSVSGGYEDGRRASYLKGAVSTQALVLTAFQEVWLLFCLLVIFLSIIKLCIVIPYGSGAVSTERVSAGKDTGLQTVRSLAHVQTFWSDRARTWTEAVCTHG